jgi:hypothetical protein
MRANTGGFRGRSFTETLLLAEHKVLEKLFKEYSRELS